MRTIDLHTHILPPSWPDLAAKAGTSGWLAIEHLGRGASGCDCARLTIDGRHFRDIDANCWDAATRLRLWSLYLPDSVPGAHALDRAALARDYPLTGALIRNVARRVALDAVLGLGEVSAARVIEAINAQQRGQSPGAGSDARRIGF